MSFRWMLVREAEVTDLAHGGPSPSWLSPREQALLSRLTFERRRNKWLLGRLAAKRVLAEVLAAVEGVAPAPGALTIDNEPSGAPFAERASGERVPYCLSISHRTGLALAVVATEPSVVLGADLETVEPRDAALVKDFFGDGEQALVAAVPAGPERDRLVARIWSAKESVLKALGTGLRLDTRTIEVVGEGGPPWPGAPAGFRSLAVRLRDDERPVLALTRDEDDLVLTVARLV